jgi:hypothetical protein
MDFDAAAWSLLKTLITTRSPYILGAGASVPEMVLTSRLATRVREEIWKNGIYLGERARL